MKIGSSSISISRNHILFAGLVVAVLLFTPAHVAHAGLGSTIVNAISNAIAGVLNVFLAPVAQLFSLIFHALAGGLYGITQYLMSIPVVPGEETVNLVNAGFEFSRQFVNIFFGIILAFIGLATILRLPAYPLTKTLTSLIITALLVNFSGLLVGVVVDVSNIFTNFFLDAAQSGDWAKNPWGSDFEFSAAGLALSVGQILYYTIASIIYLIVMLIFALRVVALWTLVILAPIAFGARILPATQNLWRRWWSQLVGWSLVGIPLSFFMYLSALALSIEPQQGGPDAIEKLFAPLSAIVLLFIGILISQEIAPTGAGGVLSWGRGKAEFVARTAGRGASYPARKTGEAGAAGVTTGLRAIRAGGRSLATGAIRKVAPAIRDKGSSIRTNAIRSAASTPPAGARRLEMAAFKARNNRVTRWAGRTLGASVEIAGGDVNSWMEEYDGRKIRDAQKRTEGMAPDTKRLNYQNAARRKDYLESYAIMATMDGDDVSDHLDDNHINEKDLQRDYKTAQDYGKPSQRAFLKRLLHLKSTLGALDDDWEDALQDIKPDDIKDISSKALDPTDAGGKEVLDAMPKHLDPQLLTQLVRRKVAEREGILKHWAENIKKGGGGPTSTKDTMLDWAAKNNYMGLVRWSVGTAAKNIGIDPLIPGLTSADIDKYRETHP